MRRMELKLATLRINIIQLCTFAPLNSERLYEKHQKRSYYSAR